MGSGFGSVRVDVRFGEKEMSGHVRVLIATDEVEKCGVSDVFVVFCGVRIVSMWVADGLFMGVVWAM